MLYDPKWEQKTDILALPTLIAWLETKNPNESYNFDDCKGGCLFSQYIVAHGIPYNLYGPAPEWLALHDLYGPIACAYPISRQTFGAALTRARAALNP